MVVFCASCGKSCATQEGLAAHSRAKRHPYCQKCHRSFADGASLGQHERNSSAHANSSAKTNSSAPPAKPPTRLTTAMSATPPSTSSNPSILQEERRTDCKACSRTFGSAEALLQHEKNSPAHRQPPVKPNTAAHAAGSAVLSPSQHHSRRQAAKGIRTAAGTSTSLPPLTHRGITYTHLPAGPDQASLHNTLLQHCHTPTRLVRQNYHLTQTATTTPTPSRNPSHPRRRAVVLDCEMAGVTGQPDQVVSLSLIDFLTGEALVDALVSPTQPVTQWRTWLTGITPAKMAAAVASGRALAGRQAAVAALFQHMDDETVLVGHSASHDLRALGVVHGRVVDVGLLGAEASGKFAESEKMTQMVGLERMCRELAGVQIRTGPGGRHDSLEDVLATREVAIWCLRHPEELREWAVKEWGWRDKVRSKPANLREWWMARIRAGAEPVRSQSDEDLRERDDDGWGGVRYW